MAHEQAPRRTDRIDDGEPHVPGEPQGAEIIRKQMGEGIGADGKRDRIEAPPGLVALEHIFRPEIKTEPAGLGQHFDQGRDVPEAQIEALTRDGMDAMGRIANEGQAGRNETLGQLKAQGIGPAGPHRLDLAQIRTEPGADFLGKGTIFQRHVSGCCVP